MNIILADFIFAVSFSAKKHKDQRRKGSMNIPYVNHPIEVTNLLARTAGTGDLVLLTATVLHDTLEDTRTEPEEIEQIFGREVLDVVLEVTDDMALTKEARKQKQIESAAHLSNRAKLIRIADKVCNVLDILQTKYHWTNPQKLNYISWAIKVTDQCKGINLALDQAFANAIYCAKEALGDLD
jgi:GTP diphosphokinase / guanosine-3',5'-bis(diphosphate) 3'-diphosphatase